MMTGLSTPTPSTGFNCNPRASCGCSKNPVQINQRIVGGETARDHSWGWVVSIQPRRTQSCGGTVLSPSWILTAAHCIPNLYANYATAYIYVGMNLLTDTLSAQKRGEWETFMHPDYNSRTHENDIALIRLHQPLDLTDPDVTEVCMPDRQTTTIPSDNTSLVAIGWGTLFSDGSTTNDLRQVTVRAINELNPFCSTIIKNSVNQFCAGVPGGGKDTCQGDSGGPLMEYDYSLKQWKIVGVTSYGRGCGLSTSAGVYARVSYYYNWINSMMNAPYVPSTTRRYRSSGFKLNVHRSIYVLALLTALSIFC